MLNNVVKFCKFKLIYVLMRNEKELSGSSEIHSEKGVKDLL